jgi:hypothetical protein
MKLDSIRKMHYITLKDANCIGPWGESTSPRADIKRCLNLGLDWLWKGLGRPIPYPEYILLISVKHLQLFLECQEAIGGTIMATAGRDQRVFGAIVGYKDAGPPELLMEGTDDFVVFPDAYP